MKRTAAKVQDSDRAAGSHNASSISGDAMLIKADEAARRLAISPRKLWELTNCGEIPRVPVGRAVRYDPRDLETWIARRKEARRWLYELRDAGLIEQVEAGRGRTPTVWRQRAGQTLANCHDCGVLPVPEAVFPAHGFRQADVTQAPENQGVLSASTAFAGNGNNRPEEVPALPASSSSADKTCVQYGV